MDTQTLGANIPNSLQSTRPTQVVGRSYSDSNSLQSTAASRGAPLPIEDVSDAVRVSFNQIGITLTAPNGNTGFTTSDSTSVHTEQAVSPAEAETVAPQTVDHALHAFMHSLFQSMNGPADQTPRDATTHSDRAASTDSIGQATTARPRSVDPYTQIDASGQLQALAERVVQKPEETVELQQHFDHLISVAAGQGTVQNAQNNLQAFLQNFSANFGKLASPPSAGSIVNVFA